MEIYLFFFSNITLVYSNNYKGSFYRLSIFAKFFQVWIPSQEQLYNVHQHTKIQHPYNL